MDLLDGGHSEWKRSTARSTKLRATPKHPNAVKNQPTPLFHLKKALGDGGLRSEGEEAESAVGIMCHKPAVPCDNSRKHKRKSVSKGHLHEVILARRLGETMCPAFSPLEICGVKPGPAAQAVMCRAFSSKSEWPGDLVE